MIDGSEKRKLQLAFELQSSRVIKKHSKLTHNVRRILRRSTGQKAFIILIHWKKNPYSGAIQLNNFKATS